MTNELGTRTYRLLGARLIPLKEAIREFGISEETFRRRMVAGELTVYRDGLDRRIRLLNRDEIEEMIKPTIERQREKDDV